MNECNQPHERRLLERASSNGDGCLALHGCYRKHRLPLGFPLSLGVLLYCVHLEARLLRLLPRKREAEMPPLLCLLR